MWNNISDKSKITASGYWGVGGIRLELFTEKWGVDWVWKDGKICMGGGEGQCCDYGREGRTVAVASR